MRTGRWDVTLVELKLFDAVIGGFLANAPDPNEPVRVAVNVLLLRRPGQIILVDTGTGVLAELVDGLHMDLAGALSAHSVMPEDIDLIVLSHLDGDHVGGALKGRWPDALSPAFPRARVLASETEIEWSRKGGSGTPGGPVEGGPTAVEALASVLEPVADNAEVAPGVHLRSAPGHTPGHSILEIDGPEPLVFAADVIHTVAVVEAPQVVVPDRNQTLGLETRRRLLNEWADLRLNVYATHIPGASPARVHRVAAGFKWVPRGLTLD